MSPLWQGTNACAAIEAAGCARRTTIRCGDRPSHQCRHRPTSPSPGVSGFSVCVGRGNRLVQPNPRCSVPDRSLTCTGRGEILSALLDCSGRVGAYRISLLSARRNTRSAAPGEGGTHWFDCFLGGLPPFHGRSRGQKPVPNRSDRLRRRGGSPCPWSVVHLLSPVDSKGFDMHRVWNMAVVLTALRGVVLQQLRRGNLSTSCERRGERSNKTSNQPARPT